MVVFNLLLWMIFNLIIMSFKLRASGTEVIFVIWAFVNPMFVMAISYFFTLNLGLSWH